MLLFFKWKVNWFIFLSVLIARNNIGVKGYGTQRERRGVSMKLLL